MNVVRIEARMTYDWLLFRHYARRIPSISFAFGLLYKGVVKGVITYGTPPSSTLRNGVCGPEFAERVIELNRLCVDDRAPANSASTLIGGSIKMLPAPRIIVSFADTSQGHIGYVYQATNFIYTGLSAKRTDWKIKGMEHLHSVSIADISRGQKDRARFMREQYGDNFYLEPRPRKHRYVYFTGARQQRREMRAALRYPQLPYPKGPTKRSIIQPEEEG